MNRVLAAERNSQAQLVDARTKAEVQKIEAEARAETHKTENAARSAALLIAAETEAEMQKKKTASEIDALHAREAAAKAYATHPALLRLQELETLRELARTATARIYIGFDKHLADRLGDDEQK
jgi:regulator of protease activity HflC (stomatin/prohibitin superfamily)